MFICFLYIVLNDGFREEIFDDTSLRPPASKIVKH